MKSLLPVLAIVSLISASASAGESGRKWLVVNEDNDHYFRLDPTLMNTEDLEAYADSFAKGGVTHIFWCTCGKPASFASDVWERIWEGRRKGSGDIWVSNCRSLYENGIDPYAVWCRRCHEKGISPWVSMRMNDSHGHSDFNCMRHTEHWRNHPELRRNPSTNCCDYAWTGKYSQCGGAYDYVHDEVKDYHFAMAKELIDRYDADGIELDWQRATYMLTPWKERELSDHLTRFVRRVREYATKRRGRNYGVAVRLTTRPEAALHLGFDFPTWAKEELVDVIIASPVWGSPDYALPVAEWKKLIANPRIKFIWGSDHGVQCSVSRKNMRLNYAKGMASSAYSQGADGIYGCNWQYLNDELKLKMWSGELDADNAFRGHRSWVCDGADWVDPANPVGARQLPKPLAQGAKLAIRLPDGKTDAKSADVLLNFDTDEDLSTLEVSVNGTRCGRGVRDDFNDGFREVDGRAVRPAWRFPFDPGVLKAGFNEVSLGSAAGKPGSVYWCEISVDRPNRGSAAR